MVGGDYCQQKSDQAFLQRHGGNVVGNYIQFLLTQKPFGPKILTFAFYNQGTDVMCSKRYPLSPSTNVILSYFLRSLLRLGASQNTKFQPLLQ